MPDNSRIHDRQQFVDDREAASILSLSRSYLRQLRVAGGGCRFARFGRAIRYQVGDLLDWAQAQAVDSTSAQSRMSGAGDRQ